ncbi:MAG: response regulator [Deltaproteobacteria bacterium]|nr:response regulator [Deltaproteobacteria bacterium]
MANGKKIFIAEDNQHFCELYRMALGAEGYEVHFAYNGKEALDKIPTVTPDLIILDVMMPEMDGYEVCHKLRDLPRFALTPVIMLTALSTDEDRIRGYQVGADDYLTKPFSLKVLKARVANILERAVAKKVEVVPAAPQTAQPIIQVAQPIVLKEEMTAAPARPIAPVRSLSLGEDVLEQLFGAPIPPGSSILALGSLGSGKSFFCRLFLAQGLKKGEKCMFICMDDDPSMVRRELNSKYSLDLSTCEGQNQIRFVDAYSWSGGRTAPEEKFAITGSLELSDLSALISEAGAELGQTDQTKTGGKRVVDSISSLFLNFELPYVQRFIAFLARSGHFAGVSTIFVVEQGACNDQTLNNIKYIMDGVLEFRNEEQRFLGRAQSMKWGTAMSEWVDITQA